MVDGFDGLQKWRLLYSNQLYIIQKQKLEKISMSKKKQSECI
jgi:hypothetical protein